MLRIQTLGRMRILAVFRRFCRSNKKKSVPRAGNKNNNNNNNNRMCSITNHGL